MQKLFSITAYSGLVNTKEFIIYDTHIKDSW